jgi:hypothetical protein
VTIFWVKTSIILGKLGLILFFSISSKLIFNFVKFVATQEGMTTNFFSSLSFVVFLDPGSGMGKNQDPG